MIKGRKNERTGTAEEVGGTLDEVVDETEDVEVVLELNLEVVELGGDRILERMLEIKPPSEVDVAGVSLSFPVDFVGVALGVVSKIYHIISCFGRESPKKNTYQLLANPPGAQLSLTRGEILSCHAMQIAFGGLTVS
jgi:hypothetical protein